MNTGAFTECITQTFVTAFVSSYIAAKKSLKITSKQHVASMQHRTVCDTVIDQEEILVSHMRGNWTQIKKEKGPTWSHRMNVTINPKGYIRLNQAALRRIGSPAAVNLLFDATNMRIGLQAANPKSANTYKVVKATNANNFFIRAYRLLIEYRVNIEETIRFSDPDVDIDGILVLNLRMVERSKRAASSHFKKLNAARRKANAAGVPASEQQ
jgi:hypothetical protein